jgi:hypothetical protein
MLFNIVLELFKEYFDGRSITSTFSCGLHEALECDENRNPRITEAIEDGEGFTT